MRGNKNKNKNKSKKTYSFLPWEIIEEEKVEQNVLIPTAPPKMQKSFRNIAIDMW